MGHNDHDRSRYSGPEHRHSRDCPEGGNRATSGRRSRGYPLVWSRKWFDDPAPGTTLHLGDGLVEVYLGHGLWQTKSARNDTSIVTVASVALVDPANFTISQGLVSPTLDPGAAGPLSLRFTPASGGPHASYLVVTLDDGRCEALKIKGDGVA